MAQLPLVAQSSLVAQSPLVAQPPLVAQSHLMVQSPFVAQSPLVAQCPQLAKSAVKQPPSPLCQTAHQPRHNRQLPRAMHHSNTILTSTPAHCAVASFLAACGTGDVAAIKYAVDSYGLSKADALSNDIDAALRELSVGQDAFVAWLVSRFYLRPLDAALIAVNAVTFPATAKGYSDVACWLERLFVREQITWWRNALSTAIGGGHVVAATWLADNFDLTVADARAHDNEALRLSLARGHVVAATWLADRFGLTAADARAHDNEALRLSLVRGHVAAATWLADRFGLTAADARAHDNEVPRLSLARCNADVAAWPVDRFDPTARSAESIDNHATIATRLVDAHNSRVAIDDDSDHFGASHLSTHPSEHRVARLTQRGAQHGVNGVGIVKSVSACCKTM